MKLEEIHPFCRLAHFATINTNDRIFPVIPLDARLFFTRSGKGEIFVDNQKYTMHEGDLLFVRPGTRYQLKALTESVQYIVINFDFTYDNARFSIPVIPVNPENYDFTKLFSVVYFDDVSEFNHTLHLKGQQRLEHFFQKIEREHLWGKLFFHARTSSMLMNLLVEIARTIQFSAFKGKIAENKIDEILTYIHNHYAEPLDNTSIGKHFSFHPNYVNQLMVKYTNMSLHQYILFVRISKARELLENTCYSITHIANAVGFNDSAYFSRFFKKTVGVSPQAYRKSM